MEKAIQQVEKLFSVGGYEAIDKQFANYRFEKGSIHKFTQKQFRIWKQYISWRWRHNNPEIVKQSNRRWYEFYASTKPGICICKYCKKTFRAPRKYYKICPKCLALPTFAERKAKEIEQRKIKKQALRKEVCALYKKGNITQQQIAYRYKMSQANVSRWLRLYGDNK